MESEIIIAGIRNTSLDEIAKIIQVHFPEYETIITQNHIILKKSAFVHVKVTLAITERGCEVGLDGAMSSIAEILFGFIFHYVFRGSILEDVSDCIKNELKENI